MVKKCYRSYLSVAIIVCVALIFMSINGLQKRMIIGSDAIFHFNRFYETAQQIKHRNLHYFMSLYGFQQTGRFVNVFYGPFFAYIQGIVVLISGSWFVYQLLSNFLLYLISGLSFFYLLRKSQIKYTIATSVAIIYMTTYNIQYWTYRQGFSSWGAAFFPLCLLPILQLMQKKRLPVLLTAFCMGLMVQIHMLSSMMLAVVYFSFFMTVFVKYQNDRGSLLRELGQSILVFSILTVNIWWNIIMLSMQNNIHPPFVNKKMHLSTINNNSVYWLTTPNILPWFLLIGVVMTIIFWKKESLQIKVTMLTALFFLWLSTSFFPWKYLLEHDIPGVSMIQFPFRFFVPFTVLILWGISYILNQCSYVKFIYILLTFFVVVSIGDTMNQINRAGSKWDRFDSRKAQQLHTFVYEGDDQRVKESFFSKDLSKSLDFWKKSTPDYVPIYHKTDKNKYKLYERYVLANQLDYASFSKDGRIYISWHQEKAEEKVLPVILYKHSQVLLNQKLLNFNDDQLTEIGNPIVKLPEGDYEVQISYPHSIGAILSIFISLLSWFLLFMIFLWQRVFR